MPLQSQQIVSMALQIAKCPGFTQQGGQFLNSLLQDLCENYDLDLALGTFTFNFNSATGQGAGPYNLPTDYLRTQVKDGKDEFFYTIQGVPYPLIQITKAEYDWLVQTPGFQSFPYNYATDLSQTPAQLFVWPPANGAYPCVLRYYRLMPDIVTPETSATVPWFNNTQVLIRGTAGLLMQLTGDDRTAEFLGDDEERYPLGVGTILKKYLKNVEDREGAVHTVGKDRRRWGRPFDQLKNTKNIGWALAAMFLGAWLYFGATTSTYANCTTPCTKPQITTDINTNWPDNTSGLITPALLRSTVNDLLFSYLDIVNAAAYTVKCNPTTSVANVQDCSIVNIGSTTTGWVTGSPALIALNGTINTIAPPSSGSRAGTVTALRTSDDTSTVSSDTNITNTSLIVVDNTSFGHSGWGNYWEGVKTATALSAPLFLLEASVQNLGSVVTNDPYTDNTNATEILRMTSGIASGSPNNTSAVMHILNNGAAFEHGIICGSTALDTTSGRIAPCLAMAQNHSVAWYSGASNIAWNIYSTATSGNNTVQLTNSEFIVSTTGGITSVNSGLSAAGALQFGTSGFFVLSAGNTSTLSINASGAYTTVTTVGGIVSGGTSPVGNTGSCIASTFVGGAMAGKFTAPACAAGTIILSSLPTSPNGYTCNAQDQTTPADTLKQTANTTSSVTFTSTTALNDIVVFNCMGW